MLTTVLLLPLMPTSLFPVKVLRCKAGVSIGLICTFFTRELHVADFSAGFNPEQWPALWADYALDWRAEWFNKGNEPPTWYMGDDVVSAGLDGLLFPSQAYAGGTNLVVYCSSARKPSQLRVYVPQGVLQ